MKAGLISIEKWSELESRMRSLGVFAKDIKESFVRSGGAGGQKVNKSSSCVVLLHLPTLIRVKCQISRSQTLNRFLARRLLLDKIEERQRGFVASRQAAVEKIRRQKRRRSRRSRQRMLDDKSRQAEKKALRRTWTREEP